jgi:cysteinyl-tRNA synthetase
MEALDDDLNVAVALAKTSEFLRAVNELCDRATGKKGKASRRAVEAAQQGFDTLQQILGLGYQDADEVMTRIRDRRARSRGVDPAHIEDKIRERTEARKNKDFARADALRDELSELGVELHDSPDGTTWSMH